MKARKTVKKEHQTQEEECHDCKINHGTIPQNGDNEEPPFDFDFNYDDGNVEDFNKFGDQDWSSFDYSSDSEL